MFTKRIAAALTLGLLVTALVPQIAMAAANCKWVKEDPKCWGDTCRLKRLCTPGLVTLGDMQKYGSGAYSRAR